VIVIVIETELKYDFHPESIEGDEKAMSLTLVVD